MEIADWDNNDVGKFCKVLHDLVDEVQMEINKVSYWKEGVAFDLTMKRTSKISCVHQRKCVES